MAEFDIDAVGSALNAAAIDADQWTPAMEAVARLTGSHGAVMFPVQGALPFVPATQSMGEAFDLYVREGWVNRDERLIRGTAKIEKLPVFTDRDLISTQEIRRNAFYQDFLGRTQLKGWAAVRVGADDQVWSLTFHRNEKQGEFSAAELHSLRELSGQLAGTAQIASTIAYAKSEAALSSFAMAGKAALLFNRLGDVVLANEASSNIFDEHVTIRKRRLVCSNQSANDRLEAALKQILWSADRVGLPPIKLPRPGKSPIVVYLVRSFQLSDTPLSAYHAIAVLVDPGARFSPALSSLRSIFELTPAEARLAIELQSGSVLGEAADRLNISPETARKQLKAIFAKTGVARQPDLIALLSNLLPNT